MPSPPASVETSTWNSPARKSLLQLVAVAVPDRALQRLGR